MASISDTGDTGGSPRDALGEAAERLGMAVRSVQLMVDRGELQAWKTPGGHRRILRSSLDAWLAANLLRALHGLPPAPMRLHGFTNDRAGDMAA